MLRFRILVSAVPLLVAAVFARGEWTTGARPCIASADGPVQLAPMLWRADLQVSFTDDPDAATVRVRIADTPDEADFVLVDDADAPVESACASSAATRLVAISGSAAGSDPVIYLTAGGPSDFKVFVQSKSFTVHDAAALLVGANRNRGRLAAAL